MIYRLRFKKTHKSRKEPDDYIFDFNGSYVYHFYDHGHGSTERNHFLKYLQQLQDDEYGVENFKYEKIEFNDIMIDDKKFHLRSLIRYIFETNNI